MDIIPNWHPVFVHYTVALLSVSVVLYILGMFMTDARLKDQCHIVARWNLWLGTGFTLVTVITGWYAYNTVAHDEVSHIAMTDHRNWALVTAILFLLVTALSIWLYLKQRYINSILVAGLFLGLILLGATAWRGGEIVYRYGLGVMSLPSITTSNGAVSHQHDHAHDDMHQQDKNKQELPMVIDKQHHDDGHSH